MFAIEKGVPAPAAGRDYVMQTKYRFKQMAVGDSFFVPVKHGAGNRARAIRGAATEHKRKWGPTKKFLTRCVDGGVRCWRMA